MACCSFSWMLLNGGGLCRNIEHKNTANKIKYLIMEELLFEAYVWDVDCYHFVSNCILEGGWAIVEYYGMQNNNWQYLETEFTF